MTVECPGCNTRFPVDHRKVPDGGVHARCSVCSDVFFVDVQSPEAELARTFPPEDESIGVGVELPEAEVLEEETAPGEEVWEPGSPAEPTEEEPEPVFEAPEAEEEEPEPAFEAPEAEEEEPEPAFEAPEAEEEEPEPAFEAPEAEEEEPEAEEEEPEPVFEASEAEEEAPEAVFEASEAGEEAPEPVLEAPEAEEEAPEPVFEASEEEERLPFEFPTIASDEPGPGVAEPESTFELPEIVPEERTFGDEAPTFGNGETTFSMDSPTFDTQVEVDEDTTPTFGDPSPTIEFSDMPSPDVLTPDETAWQATEPHQEASEPEVEEKGPAFEGPTSAFPEPERGFGSPGSVGEGFASTLETQEPAVEEPTSTTPGSEPMAPLPTPHFGRRDPREKAQRLARVLVSDIILYNPDRHQRALELGSLKEEFEDEIQKSWNEYVDQVGDEIANSTNFFNEALNEILAKGQLMF